MLGRSESEIPHFWKLCKLCSLRIFPPCQINCHLLFPCRRRERVWKTERKREKVVKSKKKKEMRSKMKKRKRRRKRRERQNERKRWSVEAVKHNYKDGNKERKKKGKREGANTGTSATRETRIRKKRKTVMKENTEWKMSCIKGQTRLLWHSS